MKKMMQGLGFILGRAIPRRRGQVMVLTVLAIGGAILGASIIAGLLTVYQIRQTTDFANSGKAIYAADAGLEFELYNWYCGLDNTKNPCPKPHIGAPAGTLNNGAKVVVQKLCYNLDGTTWSGNCATATSTTAASSTTFKAIGTSGNSSRAFGLSF